jgi:hypothetical protein
MRNAYILKRAASFNYRYKNALEELDHVLESKVWP